MTTVKALTVTPAMAEAWLEKSEKVVKFKNRNKNKNNVDKLVKMMNAGNYYGLYSEPISITSDGAVINGQHRLSAIVVSGTDQKMLVIEDADEEVYKFLDNVGKPRTNADVLSINNYENAAVKSTAFKIVAAYRAQSPVLSDSSIVGFEIIDMLGDQGGDKDKRIDELVRLSGQIAKAAKISHAATLAVMIIGMGDSDSRLDFDRLEALVKTFKVDYMTFTEWGSDMAFALVRSNKNRGGTELSRDFIAFAHLWNKWLAGADVHKRGITAAIKGGKQVINDIGSFSAR